MQQYFVNTIIHEDWVTLNDEQTHHIVRVLKMKKGQKVRIVDPSETLYIGEIEPQSPVVVTNLVKTESKSELPIKITLIAGLIKKEKWDFVLQKACELGVYQIVGLQSERSVVKLDSKIDKKLLRFNKICEEACEQCRRVHKVECVDVISFKQLKYYRSELNVIAYEDIDSITQSLNDLPKVTSITVVIGPEGGFSEAEINLAKEFGYTPIKLGNRILRAETASLVAINTIANKYE